MSPEELEGKARHNWCPQARDQLFGPEPMARDPLRVHSEAVERCRSVLREVHHESLRALTSNEATAYLLEVVEAAAITETSTAGRPMRVVLMGRTMAGKSTLLAALTGGSAERIGVGAQRTSRDVFAAPALDLQDVEIVDTPGVGARDGAEDVALAMAEVPGADLVGTLLNYLPISWGEWVTLVVTVCAGIAVVLPAPKVDSNIVWRALYWFVQVLALNKGKAANAQDVTGRRVG